MADEQPQDSANDTRKPTTMLVIATIVGGMILGALGGSFALGPMIAKKLAAPTSAQAATADDASSDEEHEPGTGEKKAGSVVHMMENLVLNPAGSNGTRFLMVAVAAEVKDDGVKEAMTGRDAEMRDAVLRLLGDHTVDQLADMSLRDGMKKQIVDSLNARLARKDAVKRVYFPQFVIQ
jgi:flagellar FliL protein